MRRCPVCETELIQGPVCGGCGFDLSCDYEQNRTLCPALPKDAEPVSARAEKRRRQERMIPVSSDGLVCPKCGGHQFFFLADELQFLCVDCGEKILVAVQKNGPVSENAPSVEHEMTDALSGSPVINSVPKETAAAPADMDTAPSDSDESGYSGHDPWPAARTWLEDFLNTSGLLRAYFWIYLASAAGLFLLARTIARTYGIAIVFVPEMLLSAVFYVVSAVFIFFCRRRIGEMPDVGSAESVRRTAAFGGTLVFIHILFTALQQLIVWFSSDQDRWWAIVFARNTMTWRFGAGFFFGYFVLMLPSIGVCAAGAAFAFRRRIREMLDAGSADSIRRTAVLFGALILIRLLLNVIYLFFIRKLDLNFLYDFYGWLDDLLSF